MAKIYPELTIFNKEGQPDGVRYDKLPLLLIQVVKEQKTEIADLKEQNKNLELRLKAIEDKLK